jgi:dipeptidyl aminopeptidase/acylaminoacyl peptidase
MASRRFNLFASGAGNFPSRVNEALMLRLRLPLIALIFIFSVLAAAQTSPRPRGLLPTDLSALKDVSDAQISPDGSKVVYVVGESAPDRSRMISRLWITPTAGPGSKHLTTGDANESTPRWSPDSKRIAFVSSTEILNEAPPAAVANDPKLAGVPPQMTRAMTREEIEKLPVEIREMIFRAQGQAFGQKPSSPLDHAISALPDDPRVIFSAFCDLPGWRN